jgi:hypothetical protein
VADKARTDLGKCLSRAPALAAAFDPKKWPAITNEVAALARLYAEIAIAFAERTNEKAQALMRVYYEVALLDLR